MGRYLGEKYVFVSRSGDGGIISALLLFSRWNSGVCNVLLLARRVYIPATFSVDVMDLLSTNGDLNKINICQLTDGIFSGLSVQHEILKISVDLFQSSDIE